MIIYQINILIARIQNERPKRLPLVITMMPNTTPKACVIIVTTDLAGHARLMCAAMWTDATTQKVYVLIAMQIRIIVQKDVSKRMLKNKRVLEILKSQIVRAICSKIINIIFGRKTK
jgi:hypothetical protein